MIEDENRAGLDMDMDIISALSERAEAMEEEWRFQATLIILLDVLKQDADDTEDDDRFQGIRDVVGTILTLMLYLTKIPSEEEIEADVAKFRKILKRVDEEDTEED
jgi:hypothetical protein